MSQKQLILLIVIQIIINCESTALVLNETDDFSTCIICWNSIDSYQIKRCEDVCAANFHSSCWTDCMDFNIRKQCPQCRRYQIRAILENRNMSDRSRNYQQVNILDPNHSMIRQQWLTLCFVLTLSSIIILFAWFLI